MSADLQAIRRRHADRAVRVARVWSDPGEDHYFHDDDGEVRDLTCRYCSGAGGDPWNDYILPCPECDGEGYRWWRV